ncbi:DUF6878 family protein [Sphingomonas adhaesiva]|uniref:DUF6878 family protein n=1 Tax=Sphingomonas adhaesiva TaxID=28212 RepID=UPI002FF96596
MSDPVLSPATARDPSIEAYARTLAAYEALNSVQRATNKAALFAALAEAGVTEVIVTFDGYGDSGQIESMDARAGDEPIELPEATVPFLSAEWGTSDPVSRDLPLGEVIERLAYDYLGDTHSGWENNDGAYGEFVFDVAAATISLDYDERYTATNNYTHEF